MVPQELPPQAINPPVRYTKTHRRLQQTLRLQPVTMHYRLDRLRLQTQLL